MALLIATLLAALPAPVTLHGVGGVTPGMTAKQVARAWGTRVVPIADAPGTDCKTAKISKGEVQGTALFEKNRFAAVFFTAGARTDKGIRIGSTLAAVRRAYGRKLKLFKDKYVPKAKNGYVGGTWKIRFDINRVGRVTRIGFGGPAVEYVEGCL